MASPSAESELSTPPDAMARFRRWAAVAVALACLGYLAYALLRGFGDTRQELSGFAWRWYVPVLALTLVNYGLRYLKWHYLLGRLGIHVPHRANLPLFVAGLGMVISPAKAGELVKPYLVRRISGAAYTQTVPALVAERATDGIAVVGLAAIGVGTWYAEASGLILAVLAAIALGLVLLSFESVVRALLGWMGRFSPLRTLAERLDEAYTALRTCLSPVPLLFTVVLSIVAWFAECVGMWLVFHGLGVDAGLELSTFLYAFSTVFGAPSPGGMGMSDVALVEGARALIPSIGGGQAVAASLLIRVATLWFGVLLGALVLLRIESLVDRHRER